MFWGALSSMARRRWAAVSPPPPEECGETESIELPRNLDQVVGGILGSSTGLSLHRLPPLLTVPFSRILALSFFIELPGPQGEVI